MKNKNIYFVGYYHGIENKKKFTELFECDNKYFLENNQKYAKVNDNTTYYPSLLYKYIPKGKKNIRNLNIDSTFKSLYKRDYRNFLGEKQIKAKSLSKDKFLLLRYVFYTYIGTYKNLSKYNPSNMITFLKDMKSQVQQRNPYLLLSLRKFRFREKFIQGYAYARNTLDALTWNKDDIYILWGKPQSSYQLLFSYLKKYDIPYFIVEYGELPGTIALSSNGIFGEYFTKETWEEFEKKPILENEISNARTVLEKIKQNQISIKSYENNMFFLMKYFWEHSVQLENRPKIIYVNGSELFASGYYHGRWGVDREGKNPNKMLLEKVVKHFGSEYMIMYKEHPMTMKSNTGSLLLQSDFPTVNFINGFSIHDTLDISDLVITLPSKVVITSLLYGKPTFVLGDFTIPKSIDRMNYYTSKNFDDIINIPILKNIELGQDFSSFVAKMLKYNLIIYDEELYDNYNQESEKIKVNNIILPKVGV